MVDAEIGVLGLGLGLGFFWGNEIGVPLNKNNTQWDTQVQGLEVKRVYDSFL